MTDEAISPLRPLMIEDMPIRKFAYFFTSARRNLSTAACHFHGLYLN